MFFDIGANVGKWTLANMNSANLIIAVEADPDTYKTLKIETGFTNKVIQMNYAVCDSKEDTIDFYKCSVNTISTMNLEWLASDKSRFHGNDGREYEKISCKTISLDKIIEKHGMPSLIKIDVEGGEFECIRSLTQKVDILCFEWASELKDIAFLCIGYLFSLGFTKFYIQNEDNYTFRPKDSDYVDLNIIREALNKTTPKVDWGMIWCK